MTFTHALATNNYGAQKFIVATSAANGTHTTLASALAAASVGDTVYLRDSVTENVTLPAGVNIATLATSTANIPSITGTVTMTAAGTSSIFGVRLVTNSAAAIAVTGSAASILKVSQCYLDFTNNTGITFSTSSSSARIDIQDSNGNLGTTGIGIYTHSSPGALTFNNVTFTNTGASTTSSTNSAGSVVISYGGFLSPVTVSSTGTLTLQWGFINSQAQNTTALTTSNTAQAYIYSASISSGTATAISVGTGTTVNIFTETLISSTNTNAISGAGTIQYGYVIAPSSESYSNTVTSQTRLSGSAFELIQVQTASASASLTFSVLNKYNQLKLIWSNAIAASAGGQAMRLRYNQGAGVVTTGYSASGVFGNTAGGPTVPATVTTFAILGGSLGNGAPACSGECLIGNPQFLSSTGATFLTTTANDRGSNGIGVYGGTFGNTAALTALEISMASGNIAQGTFELYGIPS